MLGLGKNGFAGPGAWDEKEMKASTLFVVATVLCLFSVVASAQLAQTPPALLNNNAAIDSGDDERPQVATDGNGTWISVWDSYDSLANQIGNDADIFMTRSTNNGQTWSSLGVLNTNGVTDNGDDLRPILSTDGNGNWLCVWESDSTLGGTAGSDLDILYTRSSDNGINWTAPALLNTNGTTDSRADEIPYITNDGLGNWVAVWDSSENLNGAAGFDFDVLVSRSTNNGATWSAPALLNTNGTTDDGDDIRAQIITDNTGNWLAVWHSDEPVGGSGFDFDILVARSTDNGLTWTAPVLLNTNGTTDSGLDYRPGIATDGAGNWITVWHSSSNVDGSGTDFDVYASRSSNAGVTWTAPALLNSNGTVDGSAPDEYVRVSTDGLGNWLAVWNSNDSVGGTGFDYDVYWTRSTNNGQTWTAMAPLNSTATTDFWFDLVPQVTPDGMGNWIAVWESNGDIDGNTTPDYDIVFSRFTLAATGLAATSIIPATTGPTNATSVNFNVTFSDSVVNFNNVADLVTTHSGTSNVTAVISGGPQNYTVNVTGLSGTGSFTLAVSTASDVRTLTNVPLASSVTSAPVAIDNTAPGVTLSTAAGDPVTGAITVNVALTESSTNFGAGNIGTTNASVSNFAGSGSAYSFTLTPAATGSFNASVGAGTFTDAAGNVNTASNTLSRTADLSGPAVTLTTPAGDPVTGPITVNVALTQPITNFIASDVVATNASVSGFSGSGTSYSFTLTPAVSGLFSATVPAGALTNAGGTGNSASNTLSRTANLPPPPGGSDPSPAVVIHPSLNGDPGDDERPQVVSDGAGNWVIVWDVNLALNGAAGSDFDLLVSRSTDNGATWTSPALLNTNGMTDSGTDIRPALATNNAGVWIAVWHSMENLNGTAGTDDDILFTRTIDAGATWSAPALLNTNGNGDGGADEMPRIAADGLGNWVVTWLSNTNLGTDGSDFDVFVSRSSDDGLSWSVPAVLNSNGMIDGATETRVDVMTDGAGAWIALWASDENLDGLSQFDYDILFARSTNNGATWSPSARLNTNATTDFGGDFRPALATDRAGNWVASWHSIGTAGNDTDLLVARSSNGGLTWSAPTLLNQGGAADSGEDDSVRLATDEAGNWMAVWESTENIGGSGTDYDNFIARSTDNGATWSAPALLNSNGIGDGALDLVPYVASDRAGNWVATWETMDNLNGTAGFGFDISISRVTLLPVPAVTNLSPSTITVGMAGFTLTVTGRNFAAGSVVRWNGADRTTNYVSATQLTASITAADIAAAGTASVNVFTPAPGGGLSNVANVTVLSGLVAAYGFETGTGTAVVDSSGTGNNGTIANGTWTTSGRFGNALVFNGTSSMVTIPDSNSLDLTTGLTLEAWVYPTVVPTGWRAIIVKEQVNNVLYYLHASSSDNNRPVTGVVVGGSEQILYGGTQFPANTWTHLASTYDGTTQRLYVNGVEVANRAQTGAMVASTSPLRLGGHSIWSEFFQGRIDEVRIYNRALLPAEIQTDMNTAVAP